ncbi:MAG: ATP F0F1 synthase subunit C [Proteobacteria bacterium]|jgi:F-type H+-transporting ATPase subunit c|nr:ATP F0F1 synthase subunit C [Pseudomonadota bacterium]
MDASVAKLIAAGISMIGVIGAGVGIGVLFGNYVSAGIRNPAAAPKMLPTVMLGMALSEATAIFALVVALMLLFVF